MQNPWTTWSRVAVLLTACCGVAVQAASDPQKRQLSASCSACHGTNGNSAGGTPVLAGLNREHFVKQMKDFRSGTRPATVMNKHAKGYSDAEIDKLADFFSAQKRSQ